MAKPRVYSLKRPTPRLQLDTRYLKRQRQRNRERATPSPAAGKVFSYNEVILPALPGERQGGPKNGV